ncbi:hypothetical protein Salat_2518600 [Sesamum alatum]|uniref:Uncharacterized protein n=1 Tax=Sesamum alatum TaxID=300844 RepID=A0AAE2CCD6_9LAMI|nr:hypothetical protein Salat_2518600 [Sesamum alatum]
MGVELDQGQRDADGLGPTKEVQHCGFVQDGSERNLMPGAQSEPLIRTETVQRRIEAENLGEGAGCTSWPEIRSIEGLKTGKRSRQTADAVRRIEESSQRSIARVDDDNGRGVGFWAGDGASNFFGREGGGSKGLQRGKRSLWN